MLLCGIILCFCFLRTISTVKVCLYFESVLLCFEVSIFIDVSVVYNVTCVCTHIKGLHSTLS